MEIKRYNISKPKKYIKDGQEKTQWNSIGNMVEFHKDNGSISRIIEIPAIGLEANIFPFESNPHNASKKPAQANSGPSTATEGMRAVQDEIPTVELDNDINPEDLEI